MFNPDQKLVIAQGKATLKYAVVINLIWTTVGNGYKVFVHLLI